MTSFNYYANIPNAPDNPSFDQPLMQVNSQSINSLIAVDHVGFKSTGSGGPGTSGGQHLQVTFNGKNVPGGAPTDPLSIVFTNNVAMGAFNTASASTIAETFFQNANAIYPVSMIKAFGCFDNAGNPLNTWNMSCSRTSAGIFVISMPTNCCTGTSYNIQISSALGAGSTQLNLSYVITSATQFTVTFFRAGSIVNVDPAQFSVTVMQL